MQNSYELTLRPDRNHSSGHKTRSYNSTHIEPIRNPPLATKCLFLRFNLGAKKTFNKITSTMLTIIIPAIWSSIFSLLEGESFFGLSNFDFYLKVYKLTSTEKGKWTLDVYKSESIQTTVVLTAAGCYWINAMHDGELVKVLLETVQLSLHYIENYCVHQPH